MLLPRETKMLCLRAGLGLEEEEAEAEDGEAGEEEEEETADDKRRNNPPPLPPPPPPLEVGAGEGRTGATAGEARGGDDAFGALSPASAVDKEEGENGLEFWRLPCIGFTLSAAGDSAAAALLGEEGGDAVEGAMEEEDDEAAAAGVVAE
mmetsp:Transcript_2062/g.3243  ORF Transcript_2062/g.3243 Transcript_2062/m.3243 type:complete len:150 (-) Transcript_2062:1619-2068(-)